MTPEEFEKLKKLAEEARREKDQAEGVVAQLRRQLREEFGVSSVEAASALLRKLKAKQTRLEEECREVEEEITKKWGEKQ